MAGKRTAAEDRARRVFAASTTEQLAERLRPRTEGLPRRMPGGASCAAAEVDRRWAWLAAPDAMRAALAAGDLQAYAHHAENVIGAIRVPVGIAGPLRVNGIHAHGDYPIALATTEAALIASYHRGACLVTEAGGCTAVLLAEAVLRSPAFVFRTLAEAAQFAAWTTGQLETWRTVAAGTTRHGRLEDFGLTVEGATVFVTLEFSSGDASGQNMATLAAEAVCGDIAARSPVAPRRRYVEGNLSGDKKASAQAFTTVRGRKVTAEAHLPADLVRRRLHAGPADLADYWRLSAIGGVLSGTLGVQGHFANGLAALYLATGQDVACVAESAIGVTRLEVAEDGGLYAAVTLPGIMVGTVGGGTGLPSQRACLELMGLAGDGKAAALAEVCAGVVLAGELSLIGAIAAGQFARAHRRLARGTR